jgi:hypothetical protein
MPQSGSIDDTSPLSEANTTFLHSLRRSRAPFLPTGHITQISPLAPASLLSVSETRSSTISSTGWILVRWVRDMPART